MRNLKAALALSIPIVLLSGLGLWGSISVVAQGPIDWQESASGLSTTQNDQSKTAGLSFVVRAQEWPFLSLRGGVRDAGHWNAIAGPIGIELGLVELPQSGSATLASETVDWAHNEMVFIASDNAQLEVWVSQLSPALLVRGSSSVLRLLSGDVVRNVFDGSKVTSLPAGPAYPKYVGYLSGASPQVQALGPNQTPLSSLDHNWLLLWYGDNSHFVETKTPLTYTGFRWEEGSLPHTEAYQADVPLLLVFQNQPTAIRHSSAGGVEVSFSGASGYVALLPLFGRDHPDAADTENWSQGLSSGVLQQAQWWADHLCAYPVEVTETYAYEQESDTVIFTESIDSLEVCSEGTQFAPLPPMVGIVRDELNVEFSGLVIDGNLNTEFGPSLGIENVQQYTWRVTGLKRYTDARRVTPDNEQAPSELEEELALEVTKVITAGHFAPWIYADHVPSLDVQGDIYWLNPADALYHLVEVAEALTGTLRSELFAYIQSERAVYPPEDIYNLPLDEGVIRSGFSLSGSEVFDRWLTHRPDAFLGDVPLYSFFALSRYYDLVGEAPSSHVWQKATEILDRDLREQDWATFYWFEGYDDRPMAVVNANRHFAGLVGFVKLAKMVKDTEAESLGRALLAKAVVLRLGLARYPRYLYAADLVEFPSEPDWLVRQTAGRWYGYLFTYDWTDPHDDARQVGIINQFGVHLYDHSGTGYGPATGTSVYLTAYRDMVPELARFLTDYALEDANIYVNRTEELCPHWYATAAEAVLGHEHDLSHPINSFQSFMAKAWIQQEDPEKLATYVDIPWLHTGDLFYLHKLAETIKAYRGIGWDDTLLLNGLPGDQTIYLTWHVHRDLPSGTTWQIDYQSQTGTLYMPITGVVRPTRAYTLTGLTNYVWYTVTLSAMLDSASFLTSTVRVMPTDRFVYLPLILKGL